MNTVLTVLRQNLFHPRMTNSANHVREQESIANLAKFVLVPGYDLYFDWAGSDSTHFKFRAEHRETGISIRVHVFSSDPFDRYQRVKVTCEGPRFFRKYPLAKALADRMLQEATPIYRLKKRSGKR